MTSAIVSGIMPTTKTTIKVRSPMQENDIDVGETLGLLLFFLQSRHPEVFKEFEAIRKIKQS